MTPVVHEPAISAVLDRRLRADIRQPSGKHRPTTGRIDHDIASHIFASIGAHADDVRDTFCGCVAGQQANHSDPTTNGQIVRGRNDPGNRGFRHRATRRHCIVSLIPFAETTRDVCGRVTKRIHHHAPASGSAAMTSGALASITSR